MNLGNLARLSKARTRSISAENPKGEKGRGGKLRVTIQALGWRSGGRYLPSQDDIASVAYWYQTLPTPTFPKLPDANGLEVI